MITQTIPSPRAAKLPGSPFRHKTFAVIWTATVVSNVGWWMYTAASGWLMIRLNPAPLVVSLVQVANTLPMFLFAIPAGALIDIVDKRKFLIIGEIAIAVVATLFAVLVWRHLVTPVTLLAFAFLVAAGDAPTSPAYQAIVPMLVPRSDVPKAVVANSAGVNVSRAVGPALGGALLGAFGIAAPFWINAVSNYGSIGALIWWREPERGTARLPPEHLLSAIRSGFRYTRYNASLIATLIRSAGFLLFASAYWALRRSWCEPRSVAARRYTALCSEPSAPPPSAARLCCPSSTSGSRPTRSPQPERLAPRRQPRCSALRMTSSPRSRQVCSPVSRG